MHAHPYATVPPLQAMALVQVRDQLDQYGVGQVRWMVEIVFIVNLGCKRCVRPRACAACPPLHPHPLPVHCAFSLGSAPLPSPGAVLPERQVQRRLHAGAGVQQPVCAREGRQGHRGKGCLGVAPPCRSVAVRQRARAGRGHTAERRPWAFQHHPVRPSRSPACSSARRSRRWCAAAAARPSWRPSSRCCASISRCASLCLGFKAGEQRERERMALHCRRCCPCAWWEGGVPHACNLRPRPQGAGR